MFRFFDVCAKNRDTIKKMREKDLELLSEYLQ